MNFQSAQFLLFLATLVVACGALRNQFSQRKNLLLVASYIFYMSWDWRFGALLLVTTLVHFVVAKKIQATDRTNARRLWLGVSVAAALGILAYFKYANFFYGSAAQLARSLGFHAEPKVLETVLPIGISFYTFQALSYVIDVYRRDQQACNSLRDFAVFVGFFATVLAGPITRAGDLLVQIQRQATVPAPEVEQALGLVARGFIKKVVFADVLGAAFVDPAFGNPDAFGSMFLIVALVAFSFQIYMDVSGYTDIARGSALLCGFRLPQNFNRPYLANSVSNFWQRWHMSMSGFFRDYVFIGLGGSRSGNVYLNLMLTFLAIGLWHGGGWNFLLYGALHGMVVCFERWWRLVLRPRLQLAPLLPRTVQVLLQIAAVFFFVAATRLLFRSADLESAARYASGILVWRSGPFEASSVSMGILILAAVLHWGFPASRMQALDRFRAWPVPIQGLALAGVVYLTMAFSATRAQFVYFGF